MADVVIAGASPNGLMLACELGLAGTRSVVLDPASGPNPQARANRIVGQAARLLDHRGLYSALTGTPPMSAAELEASAKRVLGKDVPLQPTSPDAPMDLRRFRRGECRRNATSRELARSGRPVLVDLTEGGVVAAAVTDIAGWLTVAAGHPVGEIAATAVLVLPDGYVAWASSQAKPEPDDVSELRGALTRWFGI